MLDMKWVRDQMNNAHLRRSTQVHQSVKKAYEMRAGRQSLKSLTGIALGVVLGITLIKSFARVN
jgi:hypothetical protein